MYIESIEKALKRIENVTVVDPEVKGLLPVYGGLKDGK